MIRGAGDLKDKIRILKLTGGQLENGYMEPETYEVVMALHAKAEDATYREFYAAAAANVRVATNYWIRRREGIEPGMFVEELARPGQLMRIVQVRREEKGKPWMLLRCARSEGVET